MIILLLLQVISPCCHSLNEFTGRPNSPYGLTSPCIAPISFTVLSDK